jgi:hypothetical protein
MTKNILFGKERIKIDVYLQTPYPVFIKILNSFTKKEEFVCIAVAFRYRGFPHSEIRVYSPCFNRIPYNIW